jgi:general secretion pathway protein M
MVLPAWIGRVAAVALLVAVLGCAYVYVVVPLLTAYEETDRAIADARELLARFERIAATRTAHENQATELRRRQTAQGYYLAGGTDAMVAAELQDRVKAAIEGNGGTLRSIQPLPGQVEGNFRRVTIRLQMMATTESLARVLYVLEAGSPILFLDNVDVQARRSRRTAEAEQEVMLTVGLDLYGYLPPGQG